jgi:hypothetical protein
VAPAQLRFVGCARTDQVPVAKGLTAGSTSKLKISVVSIFLLCCIGNLLVLQHTGLQREETEAPLLLGGPRHLTPHWALGCRGLVRDPLVPRVQGVGFRDGPPRVQGGVPAFIAPLQIFTMMQSIQNFSPVPRVGVRAARCSSGPFGVQLAVAYMARAWLCEISRRSASQAH